MSKFSLYEPRGLSYVVIKRILQWQAHQLAFIVTSCLLWNFLKVVNVNCEKGFTRKFESAKVLGRRLNESTYSIPEGCYGQKQLNDLLKMNTSRIKYQPQLPTWCSNSKDLIPEYLNSVKPQRTKAPYQVRTYQFNKSDAFRVVLKSVDPMASIKDTFMVARNVDEKGEIQTNSGRFVTSEGVTLYCCSFTDKDVARYKTEKDGTHQVVFFWVPYEEVIEDHEGNIIFIATVVKNSNEYWTNVTSEVIRFQPPPFSETETEYY